MMMAMRGCVSFQLCQAVLSFVPLFLHKKRVLYFCVHGVGRITHASNSQIQLKLCFTVDVLLLSCESNCSAARETYRDLDREVFNEQTYIYSKNGG